MVLGIPGVARADVTADFLHLGLDSIMALSVVQAARARGIALRARLVLECTNIRELAAAIDSEAADIARDVEDGIGPIPLLPNGRWLYEYGEPRRLAHRPKPSGCPTSSAVSTYTPRWPASSTDTKCCTPGWIAPP